MKTGIGSESEIISRLKTVLNGFGYQDQALKTDSHLLRSPNIKPDAVLEVNNSVIAVFEIKGGEFTDRNRPKIRLGVFDVDIPVFLVTLNEDIHLQKVLPDGSLVESDICELKPKSLRGYYTNEIMDNNTKITNGSKKVYIVFHSIALLFLIPLLSSILRNAIVSVCWIDFLSEFVRIEILMWSILILVFILMPGYVLNKPFEKKIMLAFMELMRIFSSIK